MFVFRKRPKPQAKEPKEEESDDPLLDKTDDGHDPDLSDDEVPPRESPSLLRKIFSWRGKRDSPKPSAPVSTRKRSLYVIPLFGGRRKSSTYIRPDLRPGQPQDSTDEPQRQSPYFRFAASSESASKVQGGDGERRGSLQETQRQSPYFRLGKSTVGGKVVAKKQTSAIETLQQPKASFRERLRTAPDIRLLAKNQAAAKVQPAREPAPPKTAPPEAPKPAPPAPAAAIKPQSTPEDVIETLESQDYFHGMLPRDEINCLLQENGDFLVRESQKEGRSNIVLSVFWNTSKHFIILKNENEGMYQLEGHRFETIPELIFYYFITKSPITRTTSTVLLRPIKREKWELNNDHIKIEGKVGQGNFGDVYVGVYRNPENPHEAPLRVAIKTCREELKEAQKSQFLKEARIMRRYVHPNIVRLVGVCAQRDPMMIVMELIPGGSLLTYLKKKKEPNESPKERCIEKIRFCRDAAAGMEYLQRQNCLHRDLAARNCLLGAKNVLKIGDFGMSFEGKEYSPLHHAKQIPIKWTAVEILCGSSYTMKADVWSYGILMWEIFTDGSTPYPEMENSQTIAFVKGGGRMKPPHLMPPYLASIMLSCWERNRDVRPDFVEIKAKIKEMYDAVS